jgi:hypothetical protein
VVAAPHPPTARPEAVTRPARAARWHTVGRFQSLSLCKDLPRDKRCLVMVMAVRITIGAVRPQISRQPADPASTYQTGATTRGRKAMRDRNCGGASPSVQPWLARCPLLFGVLLSDWQL